MSLHLQQRITKNERKQRRCSEIFIPLYTEVERIIPILKEGNPAGIETSLLQEIRRRELYLLSSSEFKERIDNFIKAIENYNIWLREVRNQVFSIVEKEVREGYGKNKLESSKIEEFDSHYTSQEVSQTNIDHIVQMILTCDSLGKMKEKRYILTPDLNRCILGRIELEYKEKNEEEKYEMAHQITEEISIAIIESLFKNGYCKELKEKKKELDTALTGLKSYFKGVIQEFSLD